MPLVLRVILVLEAIFSGSTFAFSAPPELLSKSVVFKYPKADPYDRENLYGFNHAPSVVKLPDGRLLAAWFSGPFEASVHQVLLGAYSADGGVSWSSEIVLQDTPHQSDFDPAFIVDGNRTWLFYTAGRWNRYPIVGPRDVERVEIGKQSFKLFGRWTENSGRSWSDAVRILEDNVGWGCRSNGIKISTGELLLPIYDFTSSTAAVVRSDDRGKTWQRLGKAVLPKKVGAGEPSVALLPSGKLLMVLRTRDGFLWKLISEDQGTTWSKPTKTDLPAATSSANIISTSDGRVLLTHNACKPPKRTPLTMRVSSDAGDTWGEPLVLATAKYPTDEEAVFNRSACYPSVTELSDGVVLVVWTEIEIESTRQLGIIHAARVQFR